MSLTAIGIGLSVLSTLCNGAIFMLIKFNDLKHLEISVKDLKDTVKETGNKVDVLAERISCMEGMIKVKSRK